MIRIKRDYPLVVCMGLFCLLITVLFGCGGPQEKINTNVVKNESTFKTSQKKDSISANEKVILCFGNSLTEGIFNLSKKVDADLIAIMNLQNKSLMGMLGSSYQQEIIANNLKVPVLCINPLKSTVASGSILVR